MFISAQIPLTGRKKSSANASDIHVRQATEYDDCCQLWGSFKELLTHCCFDFLSLAFKLPELKRLPLFTAMRSKQADPLGICLETSGPFHYMSVVKD